MPALIAVAAALCLLRPAGAALVFRDAFADINASCGDCHACADCRRDCGPGGCPWSVSVTGAEPAHTTRTLAPCPAGRDGSCVTFNVTYCGGAGASSGACYRSEIAGTANQRGGFAYGREWWFGFSLQLPPRYTLGRTNPQEEIHFQMHAEPNHALREIWRNPVFALSVAPDPSAASGMVWSVTARGDSRLNITKQDKKHYEWSNRTTIGAATGGQWVSFVYHTRFAWDDSGFVEVYRNGQKVVDWRRMGSESSNGRPQPSRHALVVL